jgi:hypothetical protein
MRKGLFLLLQIAVTLAIVAYLLHDPKHRGEMATAWRMADLRWLGLAVVLYSGVEALAAVRWRLLLRIEGFRINWTGAVRQLLTAIFFSLYAPALIGSDAIRLVYLAGERPERKVDGFAAVLMDRIIGLVSLLLLCAAAMGCRYEWLTQTGSARWLVKITLLSMGGAVAAVGGVIAMSWRGWKPPPWLPLSAQLSGSLAALGKYRRHGRVCGFALLLTIAAHACFYLVYYCAARALSHAGPAIGLGDIFSIMPIVNTLVSLPVSLSGIGVREFAFQTLLGGLAGVDAGTAVMIASTGFLVYAFWGLIGGLLFLIYPPKQIR